MASGVKALGVSRSADPPALAWFVLIPLAALVIIGLVVVISLWRIELGPSPAQRTPSPRPDADVTVHVPVVDELDVTERLVRFGPAISR